MTPITVTPVVSPDATPAVDRPITLESRLQAALEHARRLTTMYEPGSREIAVAWDTVEELWTAQRRQHAKAKTAFERYCATYPDAPECRIYED